MCYKPFIIVLSIYIFQPLPTTSVNHSPPHQWCNGFILSAVHCGFESRSGQTQDFKIDICCFSAKYTTEWGKSKDWLVLNQNNVSEWSNMSTCGLLFQ